MDGLDIEKGDSAVGEWKMGTLEMNEIPKHSWITTMVFYYLIVTSRRLPSAFMPRILIGSTPSMSVLALIGLKCR